MTVREGLPAAGGGGVAGGYITHEVACAWVEGWWEGYKHTCSTSGIEMRSHDLGTTSSSFLPGAASFSVSKSTSSHLQPPRGCDGVRVLLLWVQRLVRGKASVCWT